MHRAHAGALRGLQAVGNAAHLCLDARFAKDRIVDVTRLVVSADELRACLVMFAVDRPLASLPRHQGKAGKEKMDRGDQGCKDRARLGTLDTGGDPRFGCCDAICRRMIEHAKW